MEVASWARNHGGGIMKAPWSRNQWEEVMEDEFWRRVMVWRHQGGTQEVPRRRPGDTQEAPRRHTGEHPGGTKSHQKVSKRHPETPRRQRGDQRSL